MNQYTKYNLIILFLVFSFLGCTKKKYNQFSWVNTLPKPWELSHSEFENYLFEFHQKYSDFYDRLIAINLWRIGTPYRAFCLGEESGVDKDPLIRIDSSDCTVHILTSIVFAGSNSWLDARENIIKIHYKSIDGKDPKPTFKSRWHYTSDRLLNHEITPDITSSIVGEDLLHFVNIDLNKKKDGTEFLDLSWTLNQNIGYLPIESISDSIIQKLPIICGVAFVKQSYFEMGVVVAHEGFIINRKDFIHASSKYKKTVSNDFFTYLINDDKSSFDGVMFFKINKN